MRKKIVVLGGGLVGGPIALDLVKENNFEVSVADMNKPRLNELAVRGVHHTLPLDVTNESDLSKILSGYDLVVNAIPGFIGFSVLKTCIENGKDIVDIAFYPEDPFELSALAQQKGVKVICDMGVAPGMSNLLTGYAVSKLQRTDFVEILVGGLPKIRQLPWEYKAVFSPIDVIEEYTRPARVVQNGQIVIKEPLTDVELIDFDKVGTLEAFNSDGLRSLLKTVKVPHMVEKTLRYPGYAQKIQLLAQNGFFNKDKIEVGDSRVSPLELTAKLLFDQWKLNRGDEDITVMRVVVSGADEGGQPVSYVYDLYDEYDSGQNIHSMARTTGYSAAMAVRALAENLVPFEGIIVPEQLGSNKELVNFILEGLKSRGIHFVDTIKH